MPRAHTDTARPRRRSRVASQTRPLGSTPTSRTRILAAATGAFAQNGFDATSVDDIAAASGLNKAMVYYHFENKQALYVEIVRDMLRTIGARTDTVAVSDAAPAAKIAAFIDAINTEADARPAFPALMVREMADGARRLDADTLRLMTAIVGNLGRILDEGVRGGVFRDANPFLTYFTLIAPLVFFRVSTPVREALAREHLAPGFVVDRDAFSAHLKAGAIAVLNAGAPTRLEVAVPRAPRRQRPLPRSGVHR